MVSRHQGAARGTADGIAGVAIGELDAFAAHLVDVRSLDRLAAIAAEIAVSQIIDDDEDDVGFRGFCC